MSDYQKQMDILRWAIMQAHLEATMPVSEMIRKVKGGWKVRGEQKLYASKNAAEERARQIIRAKHARGH